jgi:hypothetical protein
VNVKFVNAVLREFTTDSETVCQKYLDAGIGRTYGTLNSQRYLQLPPAETFINICIFPLIVYLLISISNYPLFPYNASTDWFHNVYDVFAVRYEQDF